MFPNLEFIKTMLNGLRSRIEKVESWFVSNRPNWAQNDPDALDYVKGRTHYEANGKVVQLPPKFLPSPTSNTVGAIKADTVKTTDIQPVRLGTDGKLYSSGIPVFTTSGTGSHYTATVPEITNLVKGMLVVMIPHTDSTTQYPGLTINGGDIKTISRPVSTGGKSTFIYRPNLKSGIPYLLIYSDSEWLSINNVRPDGLDLLNYVSPSNGGTGLKSLTKGSYIIGNGHSSVQQKTPSEVLADIGAIPVPATASVGQVLAIKAVDETGKPTSWEAVNMPSGGGSSQWKIIRDLTITENADRVDINTDNDGKSFSLHEIQIFAYTMSYEDTAESFVFLMNGYWGASDPYFYSGFKSPKSSDNYYAYNHFIATMQNGIANVFQPWKQYIINAQNGGDMFSIGDKYQAIESVSFVGKFIAGCRFTLVGRVSS